jgi:hypothetical protein
MSDQDLTRIAIDRQVAPVPDGLEQAGDIGHRWQAVLASHDRPVGK